MIRRELIVLFICLLIAAGGCGSERDDKREEPVVTVRTVTVERREVPLYVRTSGILSAQEEIKLSFKTGGIVETIFVSEGATVVKGEKLARLDLAEIRARETQARSAFEDVRRDLTRVERLYADSAVTLELLQDAETGVEVAEANLKVAEFNLRHSTITAPENGRVLKQFVEENELVFPGIPVFLFGLTGGDWIVRVGVTDREVVRLGLGDSATVRFDAYQDAVFPALVTEVSSFADPMSGTYEVELGVAAGPYRLVSGLVAKVVIEPVVREAYDVIPIEALVEAEGRNGFVYVLDPGGVTVTKVPVSVELFMGGELAVTMNAGTGKKVVTAGALYLFDGARVAVAQE